MILADHKIQEAISQMQTQFTELREHVQKWSDLATRFDEFLKEMRLEREAMNRHSAAVEGLAKSLAERTSGDRDDGDWEDEPREIDFEQAVDEVLQLFQQRRRQDVYYSDVMEALRLDLATVMKACEELEQRGLIVGGKAAP